MAKLSLKQGTTGKRLRFYAEKQDGTGPFTGLLYNTTGLTAYFIREGDATSTAISLGSGGTVGTWTNGTLLPVDAANMPGVYELGLPNAALASGTSVWVMLQGAANLAAVEAEIELTQTDNQDAVRAGITALPSAPPNAANGLHTNGTGAGQITPDGAGNILVSMAQAYPGSPAAGSLGEALKFADVTKQALVPLQSVVTDGASTTTIIDSGLSVNKDLTGNEIAFLTGVNIDEDFRFIIGYNSGAQIFGGAPAAGLAAGQILINVAYPNAPANTDTFAVLTTGTPRTLFNFLTNGLGTDFRVLLSANAQTGVTIPTVTSVGTLTTYTGNSLQTGDAYARIGAAGVGLTAVGLATGQAAQLTMAAGVATSSPAWWTAPDNADVITSLSDLVTLLARTDTSANVAAIKVQTDKLASMLQGASPSAFTALSLALAPTGGSAPTAIAIRTEMDTNSTQLAKLGAPAVSLSADIAAIETNVLAIPSSLLDLANGVETGITLRQVMRLFTSILAGKAADSGGVYTLKRQDGTTTAVTITHDGLGNRTNVVIGSL